MFLDVLRTELERTQDCQKNNVSAQQRLVHHTESFSNILIGELHDDWYALANGSLGMCQQAQGGHQFQQGNPRQ